MYLHLLRNINSFCETDEKKKKKKFSDTIFFAVEYFSILGDRTWSIHRQQHICI